MFKEKNESSSILFCNSINDYFLNAIVVIDFSFTDNYDIVQSIANTIVPLMLLSLFFLTGLKDADYVTIVVLMSVLMWAITLYWTMYYHIKAESFKRTVISWSDD